MVVFSPLSLYTTFLAWKQYDLIFDALFISGLVYIGFVLIGFRYVKNLLVPASPHAHAAAHARNTFMYETLLAFLVFVLFVVPVVPYQAKEFEFKNQCDSRSAATMSIGNTNTTYDDVFSDVSSDSVKIPLMLSLIQKFTASFSYALMKQTGCQENFNDIKNDIISSNIPAPLRKELNDFNQQCYMESKLKFNVEKPQFSSYQNLYKTYEGEDDLRWMGSKIFSHLYYQNLKSRNPIASFDFASHSTAEQREAYGKDHYPKFGYPTCYEWWNNRLLSEISQSANTYLKAGGIYNSDISFRLLELQKKRGVLGLRGLSEKEALAKVYLTHRKVDIYGGDALNIRSGMAQSYLAGIGVAASNKVRSMTSTPLKREAMKQSLPIMQCGIYLFIVVLMPFFIVLSGYSMKSVKTFSSLLFLIILMNYFWYLIGYFEKSLEGALGDTASMDAIQNGTSLLYFAVVGMVFKFSSMLGGEGGSLGNDIGTSSSNDSNSTASVVSSAPMVGKYIK